MCKTLHVFLLLLVLTITITQIKTYMQAKLLNIIFQYLRDLFKYNDDFAIKWLFKVYILCSLNYLHKINNEKVGYNTIMLFVLGFCVYDKSLHNADLNLVLLKGKEAGFSG